MLICDYELTAQHDAKKSFYGKAWVSNHTDQTKLFSYNTHVASVFPDGRAEVYNLQSQTTARHVKEFLKQHGLKADSKAQIEKDYYNPDSRRIAQ